jgi:hypothetical protein
VIKNSNFFNKVIYDSFRSHSYKVADADIINTLRWSGVSKVVGTFATQISEQTRPIGVKITGGFSDYCSSACMAKLALHFRRCS